MTEIWHIISHETKKALAKYQWEHHKKQLQEVKDTRVLSHGLDMEPEASPEYVKEMKKPPNDTKATL